MPPARTFGLSHVALKVADPERAANFYVAAFGGRIYYRDARSVQVQGPGPKDVLAFDQAPPEEIKAGGVAHFGFRLVAPEDMEGAIAAVLAAGGELKEQGLFAPGCPYAFVADPDGYLIELWYE
ncbi:MAG: VOC family protein [Pseudomonadota bacterium]|jgi:catechol 2,3-dioxygenase-like lactoylglutathione lyase family enzyme